jgi:hypothetical protein
VNPKYQQFIDAKKEELYNILFKGAYPNSRSPERSQLSSDLEKKYPGISDYILNSTDYSMEQFVKLTNTKVSDICLGFFESMAENKYAKLEQMKGVSKEFLDKYFDIISVPEKDEKGEIVYEDVEVKDEDGYSVGKVRLPKYTERFTITATDEDDFVQMMNDLKQESIDGVVDILPDETITPAQNPKASSDSSQIDKVVFDSIQKLMQDGVLQYTQTVDGEEKIETIDFAKDVGRLIAKGNIELEFENNLGLFLDQIGLKEEITTVDRVEEIMYNGVPTTVTNKVSFKEYRLQNVGFGQSSMETQGLTKVLCMEIGRGKDGSKIQLAPEFLGLLRKQYKEQIEGWLQKENILTFDSEAKNKFITFFNGVVNEVANNMRSQHGSLKKLENLQVWSYKPLSLTSSENNEYGSQSRVQQIMDSEYYGQKANYYNKVNRQIPQNPDQPLPGQVNQSALPNYQQPQNTPPQQYPNPSYDSREDDLNMLLGGEM